MVLEIENLSFSYKGDRCVLDEISLSIPSGAILGILGPNGTGKSTFIKCINGILTPKQGNICLEGKKLQEMNREEIAKIMAYVPQYTNNLFSMSVIDTVLMGRLPHTGLRFTQKDREIVFDILRRMGLEQFAFQNIKELSGGERQCIFIARAMAQEPKIIIMDEPTSSLDLHNQIFILDIVTKLAQQQEIIVIMTIHDLNLASLFCTKILMLKKGKIFAYGDVNNVLTEKNINEIYQVHTKISNQYGHKYIHLLKGK